MKGLLISAPSSGAGKTIVTLGLLRALRNRGLRVAAAKSGPDYIDPRFHEAATGGVSINLDAWAMSESEIRARVGRLDCAYLVIEGAVGLLDGAPDGQGSAADLAAALGAPVVMVLDAARQAGSAPLPLAGARALRPDLSIAGAILNRVGSERHARIAGQAIEKAEFTSFGGIARNEALTTPSRHLGLVQAEEREDLEAFIQAAAETIEASLNLDALIEAAAPLRSDGVISPVTPPGQRIAVARDKAYAFSYPHMLSDWRKAGAEVSFFSPLANEGPGADADAVFLPGGYPELSGGAITAADVFKAAMNAAVARGARIYGECGGYMTLGRGIIDKDGARHEMLGLLPLETSFATRKLHLGYRSLATIDAPWLPAHINAHEFHYATIAEEGDAPRLFAAKDAEGADLGEMGLRVGQVAGSFAHIIAPDFQNP